MGERSYPIFIGPGLLKETDRLRSHLGQGQAVIITNDTVAPLYLDQVKQTLGDSYGWEIILPDGETHKTLGTISQIYDRLLRAKADRQTTLVALGQQNSLITQRADLENITQLPQILTVTYTFPTVEITHRVAEIYTMQLI